MNKNLKLRIFSLLVLITGCLIVYGQLYSAPPITGVVRDASTGLPINNAVVLAVWFSQRPGFHSPGRQFFEAQETVTNEYGKYLIPGWKIKFLPRLFAGISTDEPQIVVYKYGYLPNSIKNFSRESKTHGFFIQWPKNSSIDLELLSGSMEEKILKFQSSDTLLPILYDCKWERNKLLLIELYKFFEDKEKYIAETNSLFKPVEPWFYQYRDAKSLDCVTPYEFIKSARIDRNKENVNEK